MRQRIKFIQLSFFAAALCLIGFSSCKKDNNFNPNYQYNYYPLDSGHYVIYDVDSIQYSYNAPLTTYDTIRYQWMEVVTDTFYDNQNRLNYMLEFWRRPDSLSSWTYDRKWYAYRSIQNLQIVEDDLRFVAFVFPPKLNESWNGNVYLPTTDQYSVFQNWNYFFENIDTTLILNGQTYNNVAVVSEINQQNLIQQTIKTEMYAPNVGLVYQQWDNLTENDVDSGFVQGPLQGFKIRISVNSYHQ